MRIVFAGTGLGYLSGGTISVTLIARSLLAQGHDVEVIQPRPPEAWWPADISVRQGDIASPEDVGATDALVTSIDNVAAALRAGGGCVVHMCAGFEPDLWPRLRDRFERAYRLPTLKVVVAPHLQRSIMAEFGVDSVVIGTAIDLSSFTPVDQPPADRVRPHRVLLVGPEHSRDFEPVPFKRIGDAIAIAEIARSRGHSIELVRLTPRDDCLSDSPAVDEMHVAVAPDRVPDIYRSCDSYLGASSAAEGLGMPAMEAACSGLALAIPAIPSYSEIPGLERAALFYPPGDLAAGADALGRLISDGDLRSRLRSAGPRIGLQEHFDPAGVATRLVEAIRQHGPDRRKRRILPRRRASGAR